MQGCRRSITPAPKKQKKSDSEMAEKNKFNKIQDHKITKKIETLTSLILKKKKKKNQPQCVQLQLL